MKSAREWAREELSEPALRFSTEEREKVAAAIQADARRELEAERDRLRALTVDAGRDIVNYIELGRAGADKSLLRKGFQEGYSRALDDALAICESRKAASSCARAIRAARAALAKETAK